VIDGRHTALEAMEEFKGTFEAQHKNGDWCTF